MRHLIMISAILLLASTIATAAPPTNKSPKPVSVTGKLEHGLFAIGAETTGTVVKTNGRTYELNLKDNATLIAAAEALNGQDVIAVGTLRRVSGTEIGTRWILDPTSLKAAALGENIEKAQQTPAMNTTQGVGNSITPVSTPDAVRFVIRSQTGIMQGKLVRPGEAWPASVQVEFHGKGMERCQITNGKTAVTWSVNSRPPYDFRVSKHINGDETQLSADDPFYSPVKTTQTDVQGARLYALAIPAALLADNPLSLKIQLVDFFR